VAISRKNVHVPECIDTTAMFNLIYEREGQFVGKESYKQYTKTDSEINE